MSFMDKVKSGLSEAGSKAKLAVETNKLKTQLAGKQKEIEKHYSEIGRIVFRFEAGRSEEGEETDYQSRVQSILQLEQESIEINKQIKLLSNEKGCACGKSVPLDTRFCPSCGHTFPESE